MGREMVHGPDPAARRSRLAGPAPGKACGKPGRFKSDFDATHGYRLTAVDYRFPFWDC